MTNMDSYCFMIPKTHIFNGFILELVRYSVNTSCVVFAIFQSEDIGKCRFRFHFNVCVFGRKKLRNKVEILAT